MAQQPDLPGPTTSYSDPIYDRLETVAQRITKRLPLILLALVVIIAAAAVTHSSLRNTPVAASASHFMNAMITRRGVDQTEDPVSRAGKLEEAAKAFAAVATDESVTPYYRARAYIEITQIALDRSISKDAKDAVEKARSFAAQAADPDLDLAIGLSEAAVYFQDGKFADAETRYRNIERAAGSKYPDRQIAAILGAAQSIAALGNIDDAIAKLESVINRSDTNATMLVRVAKSEYWALKRRKIAPPVTTPPAPATGAITEPPAAPAPAANAQPAAASIAVPPVIAPAAPPASVTPAPAVPAPSPEGK
jgi:tetratricopeptide (TPR) repeat protein